MYRNFRYILYNNHFIEPYWNACNFQLFLSPLVCMSGLLPILATYLVCRKLIIWKCKFYRHIFYFVFLSYFNCFASPLYRYELDSGNDESRALFPPFQFLYPSNIEFGSLCSLIFCSDDGITSKDAASIFWTAFKLAFYASLVGCVLFGCYLLYGHYSKDLATNKRFY